MEQAVAVDGSSDVLQPLRPPGLWSILGILAALGNLFLAFVAGALKAMPLPQLLGYSVGGAFFWPVLVVFLFTRAQRFKNPRSRWKIFFWTSAFIMLALLGSIASAVQPPQ